MKALITGGTGFIGSRLANRYRGLGHEVIALGQVNSPMEEFRQRQLHEQGIEIVRADLQDRDRLAQLAVGCDIVFHLAAAQHEANVPDSYFFDINVEGVRNILDAAVLANVGMFVHGSTIGVYGSALDGEIDESSQLRPDNIYGTTKLEGESLVLSYRDRLPVTIIRISETYGPGDGRLLKLFKAIRKRRFFIIGRGENIHQLVYVDDLIDGLVRASETPACQGEVIVLAGKERLSTTEMCQSIATAVDQPLISMKAPMWPFLTLAVAMEKILSPVGIQPPLHRRRLDFFRKSFYFRQDKAQKMIDFEPSTSFTEGSKQTADWYSRNGFL